MKKLHGREGNGFIYLRDLRTLMKNTSLYNLFIKEVSL